MMKAELYRPRRVVEICTLDQDYQILIQIIIMTSTLERADTGDIQG